MTFPSLAPVLLEVQRLTPESGPGSMRLLRFCCSRTALLTCRLCSRRSQCSSFSCPDPCSTWCHFGFGVLCVGFFLKSPVPLLNFLNIQNPVLTLNVLISYFHLLSLVGWCWLIDFFPPLIGHSFPILCMFGNFWMPGIMHLTLLGIGYFYISRNILEFCF